MGEDGSMQTVNRAIKVLKSFTREERELTLADLHHKLNLSKSSLQRILNTFVKNGFLEKDHKKKTYKLGIELYYIGKLVEEHSHLISISKPFLKDLCNRLGENVYLNVIDNNERKCIAIEKANHLLMTISYVGHTSPLHAGASAKVLLAYQDQYRIEEYIRKNPLTNCTGNTITDPDKLRKELAKIRENGYAISYNERIIGGFGVSAPIFNRNKEIVASVSISAPLTRLTQENIQKFIESIIEVSNLITMQLKYLEET